MGPEWPLGDHDGQRGTVDLWSERQLEFHPAHRVIEAGYWEQTSRLPYKAVEAKGDQPTSSVGDRPGLLGDFLLGLGVCLITGKTDRDHGTQEIQARTASPHGV